MAKEYFPRYFNDNDFNLTSDEDADSGKFTEIMSYQVPAQTQVAWGIGQVTQGGADTRKNVKLALYNTSDNQIHGVVRFALTNASETDIRIKLEDRTENLDDGVEFGETKQKAGEDSYLKIYFRPDSSDTIDHDNSNNVVLLPASVYQ